MADALKVLRAELLATQPKKAQELINAMRASNRGFLSSETLRAKIATILNISLEECEHFLQAGEVKDQQVLDFIAELRPTYKTALLSNVSKGGLTQRFTAQELTRYFDVVIVSGEIGFAKPEATAYEVTAQRLGVRLAECIMVDDLERHCRGAEAVGMQAILYESLDQLKRDLQPRLTKQA